MLVVGGLFGINESYHVGTNQLELDVVTMPVGYVPQLGYAESRLSTTD
jgi:hypothetical protein